LLSVTTHATADRKFPFLSLILADLEHKFSSLIFWKRLLPFTIQTSTADPWWQIPFKSITQFSILKLLLPLHMQWVSYNSEPPNTENTVYYISGHQLILVSWYQTTVR